MRLCFLSLEDITLPPGGIATYLNNICVYLAKAGHDIHVISRQIGEAPREYDYEGVHIHEVSAPGPTFFYAPLYFINARKKFLKLNRQNSFDLVHSDPPLMATLSLAGLKTPPVVETVHTTIRGLLYILTRSSILQTNLNEVLTILFAPILFALEKWQLRKADRVICVSQGLLEETIAQYPFLANKCVVIPNGIEFEKFRQVKKMEIDETRKSLGLTKNTQVILYLGRLMQQKRVLDLVYSLPKILAAQPDVKLLIIGRLNKNARILQETVKSLKLDDHVIMMDHVDYNHVQVFYALADVYALPSSYEGFPFTILEAMAAGTPVIAADIPGIREQIVHGESGLLHPVGDIGQIADGIIWLLKNKDKAKRISEKAGEFVRNNNTWEIIGSRTEDLFRSVIQNGQLKKREEDAHV